MKIIPTLLIAISTLIGNAAAQLPGSFTAYGTGCASQGKLPPKISVAKPPVIGGQFTARITNLPPNAAMFLIAGFSDKTWVGLPLPYDMKDLGAPGCNLYSSGECLAWCRTVSGTVNMVVGLPDSKQLIGTTFYMQVMVPDKSNNPAQIAVSHGGKFVIGG
jgi:hypothetical protein